MPSTINKPGYWQDEMLNKFMHMMEVLNQRGNVQTHVETPPYQLDPANKNAYGPNGIPQPGVELLPPEDLTKLILQAPRR